MKKGKIFYMVVALLLLVMGLLLNGCSASNEFQPVGRIIDDRSSSEQINQITVRGLVESGERRNVYTTLGSMIDRVYVEAGDAVTVGQVLAVLDTEDLVLTIAQQRAALELARENSQLLIQNT